MTDIKQDPHAELMRLANTYRTSNYEERDSVCAALDAFSRTLTDRIAELEAEAMTDTNKGRDIDEQYASKLALELECMLIDPNGFWDKAAAVLDAYKAAWEEVNPSPPTFMGEPIPPERKAILQRMKAEREGKAE